MVYVARMHQYYMQEVVPVLQQRFGYRNVMQVPYLEKIILNMGLGEAIQNPKLLDAGVQDSKRIGSDARIRALAESIRKTTGGLIDTVLIGPEKYNELYEKFGNLNTLLAWGHARVIENLMLQKHRMNPPPVRAISDQFASSKDVVAKSLIALGREIERAQKALQ